MHSVSGDVTRLRQILVNLISKPSNLPAEGEVSVLVDAEPVAGSLASGLPVRTIGFIYGKGFGHRNSPG